jgi:hypothetical protein
MMSEVRTLYRVLRTIRNQWRWKPNGYAALQSAARAYAEAGERLRQALPVRSAVAYAYNPHENTGSNGSYHITLKEPLRAGRLKREAGDALCKPAREFWGLDEREPGTMATCLKCLETAERLAEKVSS